MVFGGGDGFGFGFSLREKIGRECTESAGLNFSTSGHPLHPDSFPHQVSVVQIKLLILLDQSMKPIPDQADKKEVYIIFVSSLDFLFKYKPICLSVHLNYYILLPISVELKQTGSIGVESHERLFPCPRYRQLPVLRCLLHWMTADLRRRVQ